MSLPRSVCVYCGSSEDVAAVHKEAAADLGRILAENGIRLVYGGGRIGLMGVLGNAARAAGGELIGIIPNFLLGYEVGAGPKTDLLVVDSMHERKRRMAELADAFVVLSGGIGTLDETVEIITWRQLNLHDKPVLLVNIDGYWDRFLALTDHFVATGFSRPNLKDLFIVVDGVSAILPALAGMPAARRPAAIDRS